MISLRNATNQQSWNQWFLERGCREFLQSWEWGEIQRGAGREVFRLQVIEDNGVAGQLQGFRHKLFGLFSYIYFPRVFVENENVVREIFSVFKKGKEAFLRFEPAKNIGMSSAASIVSTAARQPKQTLLLDLTQTEDQLLAGMHPKTRYNIRLAERKGVVTKEGKNVDLFWELNRQTTDRDDFTGHDKAYYAAMLKSPICHQLTAWYNEKPIASNLYIAWNGRCTYLHGASSDAHRNVMAPYLLQWTGIRFAKKLGNKAYDFWGVAPLIGNNPPAGGQDTTCPEEGGRNNMEECFNDWCWEKDHKWSGVTRFKAGFGGFTVPYPEAADVIISPVRYRVYRALKGIDTNIRRRDTNIRMHTNETNTIQIVD